MKLLTMVEEYDKAELQRFIKKAKIYETADGCWLLTRRKNNWYVDLSVYGKSVKGHIFSYRLYKGEIPPGFVVDHLCRNPPCINPAHLDAVTQLTNLHRSPINNVHKTHCKRGHEYTPENTYYQDTRRSCKTCRRENGFRWREQHANA